METKKAEKKIKAITSAWFFDEPLLFSLYCTHTLVPVENLGVPFRCGKMRIEYSPVMVEHLNEDIASAYLTVEMYRILLQHPYSRQPHNAQKGIMLIASDMAIYQLLGNNHPLWKKITLSGIEYLKNQAVRFHSLTHPLGLKWSGSEEEKFFQRNLLIDHKTGALVSVDNLSFEQWYKWIHFLVNATGSFGENAGSSENAENSMFNSNAAELWEENHEAQQEIQEQIQKADAEQGWGGIGGNLQRSALEEASVRFDYRKALAQFRASIVASSRSLTRMRPNRRYGFKAMGSRYDRKANLLIAVDVSGSITDESFNNFYHIIKNIFFLKIIEKIDVIFFDVNLKYTKPVTINKKVELKDIKGRGGTNFQPAIDFYFQHKNEYNGLIMFTDGEGQVPVIPDQKSNILWILDSRLAYEKAKGWINTISGNKSTYIN